jgi:type IV pilus assembly protein PilY1
MTQPASNFLSLKRLALAAAVMLPLSAQAVEPHNVPLFLTTGVSPNFVITLDDSGSMAWTFAPDSICTSTTRDANCAASVTEVRRFKSSTFNPLYYNPDIRYLPPLDANGVELTTTFAAAWRNGFYQTHGSRNLETQYRPQTSFYPTGTGSTGYSERFAEHADGGTNTGDDIGTGKFFGNISVTAGTNAYYYNFVSTLTNCDGTIGDDDCYQPVFVNATSGPATADIDGNGVIDAADKDERQNFANWYSFYRTRNLATITAASRAFQDITPEMRVAWQALSACTTFGTSCKGWDTSVSVENQIRRYDAAHKARLYKWLFRLPANGGTPLRQALGKAGEYFTIKTGVTSPYAFDPQVDDDAAKRYSCRANFSMVMTDGIWNGNNAAGTISSDSTAITALPKIFGTTCAVADPNCVDSPGYTPVAPYTDTNSNSLADVAFHYWATDLNDSLKNDVPRFPSTLDNVDAATLTAAYWDPKNDPAKWQHMVTYTVGLGLTRVLDTTTPKLKWDGDPHSSNTSTSSYPELKSGGVNWPATGTDKVGNVADLWHAALNSRGKFFSADDPETLNKSLKSIVNDVAAKVGSSSSIAANSKRLETSTRIYLASFDSNDWTGDLEAIPLDSVSGLPGTPVWAASANLPAPAARNIWTTSAGAAASFTGAFGGTLTADVVNYLRGDQSQEVQFTGGTLRSRSKVLGDIVNSDPVFVGGENFRLETIPAYATSYPTFVSGKSTTSMIYVGANDGMLHGFDAATGVEKFAYVPSELHSSLADLTDVAYPSNHKYFVDGAAAFGDAEWGGTWRTVLLGTLGAGGKSVFALDITNPDAMDGTKVLWEFNGGAHASKMGYIFGPATIAPFADGHFYAVFSNGYGSTDKQAGLFLVQVDNPSNYYFIDTKYGSATEENGLSTPKLVDLDNDRIIDAIYAGDLQGNVWKFDVSASFGASWKIAQGSVAAPQPMFVAKDGTGGSAVRQPIQAQLGVTGPPSGVAGKAMVYFGTGRYFVDGDSTVTDKQSFYGVLDDESLTTYDRNNLWTQSIVYQGIEGSQEVRVTSNNPAYWTTKKGWVLDLVAPDNILRGERVISPPLLRFGRVIFNTLEPSVTDPCLQGSSWLMELDAETGGNLDYSALDIDGDGDFDAYDFVEGYASGAFAASGVRSGSMTLNQPTVVTAGSKEYKFSSNVGKGIGVITEKSGSTAGRTSWRQIQ